MAIIDKAVFGWLLLAIIAGTGRSLQAAESADVSVRVGPTEIPRGNARGAKDITLRNGRLAVAFAVETAPPWGVARGGIVDVAEVRNGKLGPDRASLVDFMPNNWSSWPSTYQHVTIEKDTPAEAVVKTVRDWGSVELVTTFGLKAGDNKIHLLTEMRNTGKDDYQDLLSGYVLWPAGGYLFGVPGTIGEDEGTVEQHSADWSAAYDQDWALGLHAPFADHFDSQSRDRYLLHSLHPGATRRFEAWLEVDTRGELAGLVRTEIELGKLPAGRLSGRVSSSDGHAVDAPAVIVEKITDTRSYPYTWVIGEQGRYSIDLPAGRYRVYATASGHSKSKPVTIDVAAGARLTRNFGDLQPPGILAIQIRAQTSQQALDARMTIEKGEKPLVEYFGKTTFFSELEHQGEIDLAIAPGTYQFKVASSDGFRARPVMLDVSVASATRQNLQATIALAADPAAKGWYCSDLHHHSDVLDGFTAPEFVFRSELAAGLDLTFLSDHDSVINNQEMQRLATSRGVPFIPATELSPSWAHFNAYPLDADKQLAIDPGRSTVQQIFSEARRMGADIIAVNHPYIAYGYFRSQELNQIPGGYSSAFDLVEISSSYQNEQTVAHAWQLWNAGQKAYFSAGSDVHDVWRALSGAVRMYVKVDGELTVGHFVAALKHGHGYATLGPLVYPELMFGEEVRHPPNTPLALNYSVQAVAGLKAVTLIERGQSVEIQPFAATTELTPVSFIVRPRGNSWYSLVVEDMDGHHAYTNPVWVSAGSAGESR